MVKVSSICDSFIYKMAILAEVEQFILLSTSQVYEIPKTREPIREDDDIKCVSNYAALKYNSEKALQFDIKKAQNIICAIVRTAPVYSLDYAPNLNSKITDPKDNTSFIYRTGDYGFHFCCLHNLVDFMLCFLKQADSTTYSGFYNVADKMTISALEIVEYMRANHKIGPVLQRKEKKDTFIKDLYFL